MRTKLSKSEVVYHISNVEEAHIVKALEASKNFEEASDTLDSGKATLYRKRKKLGLD